VVSLSLQADLIVPINAQFLVIPYLVRIQGDEGAVLGVKILNAPSAVAAEDPTVGPTDCIVHKDELLGITEVLTLLGTYLQVHGLVYQLPRTLILVPTAPFHVNHQSQARSFGDRGEGAKREDVHFIDIVVTFFFFPEVIVDTLLDVEEGHIPNVDQVILMQHVLAFRLKLHEAWVVFAVAYQDELVHQVLYQRKLRPVALNHGLRQ